jgi:predicted Zn finger-like uncharacterized protein
MKPSVSFMILTCPECATRYRLDPALLAPKGCRVRCTACATVWFEKPEKTEDRFEPPPSSEYAPPVEDIPKSVRPLPDPLALRAAQTSSSAKSKLVGLMVGVALAGVLAAGLAWTAVERRGEIVGLWVPSALVFEMVGLKISLPGEGLVFDQIKTALVGTPEAGATLTVTGKIINMTNVERALPPVTVSLSDAQDPVPREIWPLSLPISRIEAEKAFPFTFTHAVKEGDGERLTLRFSGHPFPLSFVP